MLMPLFTADNVVFWEVGEMIIEISSISQAWKSLLCVMCFTLNNGTIKAQCSRTGRLITWGYCASID